MIFYLFFAITLFDRAILIHANEQFHFGFLNHQTQWHFHCPGNHTRMLNPPSNDQPLISYDCPHQSSVIEILPMEVDFTFLCRSSSRLVWIIIDLYQYNTNFWLIEKKNLEVKVELNRQIQVNTSKIELKNFTNRLIIIHAFYIPFEFLASLLNQEIEILIHIRNLHQLNQCQFLLKDHLLWKTFLEEHCHEDQSITISLQHATCDFYSNPVQMLDDVTNIPDLNLILSIKEDPLMKRNLTVSSIPSYHRYLLLEEHYRQILLSLSRSTHYSMLLKLTLIFLILTLILLILFFLYMLCYHHRHQRSRLSASI